VRVLPRTAAAGPHPKVKMDSCAVSGGSRCSKARASADRLALPNVHALHVKMVQFAAQSRVVDYHETTSAVTPPGARDGAAFDGM